MPRCPRIFPEPAVFLIPSAPPPLPSLLRRTALAMPICALAATSKALVCRAAVSRPSHPTSSAAISMGKKIRGEIEKKKEKNNVQLTYETHWPV